MAKQGTTVVEVLREHGLVATWQICIKIGGGVAGVAILLTFFKVTHATIAASASVIAMIASTSMLVVLTAQLLGRWSVPGWVLRGIAGLLSAAAGALGALVFIGGMGYATFAGSAAFLAAAAVLVSIAALHGQTNHKQSA